jgi:hypothetical protein
VNGTERYPTGGYTGLGAFPDPPPKRGPGRPVVLGAGVLLGVLLTVGVLWLTEPEQAGKAQPAPGGAGNDVAYRAGTCLYETPGASRDSVALRVTGCTGPQAVFMIDHVATPADECARHGDYARYGLVQRDTSARSMYCLSLAVPKDACLRTEGGVAPQRSGCVAGTRRVADIRTAAGPATACDGIPAADPWYHDGRASGRIACVVPESG